MGLRAHIITKYKVEHNGSSTFSYCQDKVEDLLTENGIDFCTHLNDDGCGRLEISTFGDSGENYQKYLNELAKLPPDETNEFFPDSDYDHAYDNEHVLKILKRH